MVMNLGNAARGPAMPDLCKPLTIAFLACALTPANADDQQAVKASIANGRLSVSSADGDFTATVRALLQFDMGYYTQGSAAASLPSSYGPDLSSGSNFRRAQIGLQGKLFRDWSYFLNFDFGGSGGSDQSGRVQMAYLEYDGLAPWAIRVGAYPAPANFEDSTSSADTIFLERNSPSDLQRNLAGGDGREAVSLIYAGSRLYGALSFSAGKIRDAASFDQQQAVVGRLSYLLHSSANSHFLIGVNGTHVFKLPDVVANSAFHSITLSDPPELTVDSNGIKLANTGALVADHVSQWGAEAAGNLRQLYVQAGYYAFAVDRTAVAYQIFASEASSALNLIKPSDNSFDGWYVQASWTFTGESRTYNASSGSFSAPKPGAPFSFTKGGWGAWEFAARYSDLNLNDHARDTANVITNWTGAATQTYTFYNTVRGGDQRIVTVGLNWYPNAAIRFALDYQRIDASRLQAPTTVTTTGTPALPAVNGGQTLQAVALRAQLSL